MNHATNGLIYGLYIHTSDPFSLVLWIRLGELIELRYQRRAIDINCLRSPFVRTLPRIPRRPAVSDEIRS